MSNPKTIISFDDLDPNETPKPHHSIPNGYAGFDWSNVDFISDTSKNKYDNRPGIAGGTTSGTSVAIMTLDAAHTASISLDGSFSAKGAEITSSNGQAVTFYVEYLRNGSYVTELNHTVQGTSPTYVNLTIADIYDKIVIGIPTSETSATLVMDDLTVSKVKHHSAATVHETAFAGPQFETHPAFVPMHGAEHLAIA